MQLRARMISNILVAISAHEPSVEKVQDASEFALIHHCKALIHRRTNLCRNFGLAEYLFARQKELANPRI